MYHWFFVTLLFPCLIVLLFFCLVHKSKYHTCQQFFFQKRLAVTLLLFNPRPSISRSPGASLALLGDDASSITPKIKYNTLGHYSFKERFSVTLAVFHPSISSPPNKISTKTSTVTALEVSYK